MLTPTLETRFHPPHPVTADFHRGRLDDIKQMCREWTRPNLGLLAGFTYWGQFLAHELDPRPLLEPKRTPVLDLDSLYGNGTLQEPRIAVVETTGKFLLDRAMGSSQHSAHTFDLARNEHGKPLIPELRNDENLLIAQFHLLLQRAHNAIINTLRRTHPLPGPAQEFARARRVLTAVFQQLTITDFLENMVQPAIYEHLVIHGHRHIRLHPAHPLPVEITHAALRFGHSLIRDDYRLNDVTAHVPLQRLFDLTSGGILRSRHSLPADHCVDWSHFFHVREFNLPQSANKIDPHIVPGMQNIQTEGGPHDVLDLNLKAGIRALLPSGQIFVSWLLESQPALAALGLDPDLAGLPADASRRLVAAGIRECTPLWIHVLVEALSVGNPGLKLGPLGSLLLCELLLNACDNAAVDYRRDLDEFCRLAGFAFTRIQELVIFVNNNEAEEEHHA